MTEEGLCFAGEENIPQKRTRQHHPIIPPRPSAGLSASTGQRQAPLHRGTAPPKQVFTVTQKYQHSPIANRSQSNN